MGAVYLAEHPGIGRKAAVKVLHPSLADKQDVVTRFLNEARAANAVRHPGIVEIFDFGTLASGATYIIMEFLEGQSLAARFRKTKRFEIDRAVEIACQIAAPLGAAHEKGIVHRDLKPDNLFLVPDPHMHGREALKVLDFGIAKLILAAPSGGSMKTRTGTIIGTPVYMSPEQCRGTREVDHRTDIYALGVILYEMVCGEPPFVSEGQGELIHMHIATAPSAPRSHNPAIPEDLEEIILRALAKDPNDRFQTMDDFAGALKGAPARAVPSTQIIPVNTMVQSRSTLVQPVGTMIQPQPERTDRQTTFSSAASMIENSVAVRSRPRWIVPGALVGVVAIGSGAWLYLHPPGLTRERPAEVVPASQPLPSTTKATSDEPKEISIGIASEPTGARVVRERDGADIGVTPLKESWPIGTGIEKVRIEADGFLPEHFIVPLDRGVDLRFTLTKIPSVVEHKKSHGLSRAATAKQSAKPSSDAPVTDAPTTPKLAPREPVPL